MGCVGLAELRGPQWYIVVYLLFIIPRSLPLLALSVSLLFLFVTISTRCLLSPIRLRLGRPTIIIIEEVIIIGLPLTKLRHTAIPVHRLPVVSSPEAVPVAARLVLGHLARVLLQGLRYHGHVLAGVQDGLLVAHCLF